MTHNINEVNARRTVDPLVVREGPEWRACRKHERPTSTEYEYGIQCRFFPDELERSNLTRDEAYEWVGEWVMGRRRVMFGVIKRSVGAWERA